MAEPQPKGDILALEEELEREREDASRAFEDVRQRLRVAGSDDRLRGEAETRLAERSQQIQQELEQLEAQIEAGPEVEERVRRDVEREITARIEEIRSGAELRVESEQRRLDELVGKMEEAGRLVAEAESRLDSEIGRLQGEAAERLEAESRRAEAAEAQAERLRGETEKLRAALDRERSSGAARVKEAEERASTAERIAAEAEEARLDREADARSSAAAWLRGQARAIEAKAEKAARERVSAARRDAVEKVSREAETRLARERERAALEAEERIRSEVARARREITSEAELHFADRDRELDSKREETRYRELRNRIGSVRETAPRAQASAPAADEPATAEQPAEGPLVDVNEATFEQLRQAGLSVTQATRVIAYRQRRDGFESVDELETIPGFPKSYLDELKQRLSA